MKRLLCLLLSAGLSNIALAFEWDPVGDIQNPGRILDNVQREAGTATGNVGRELDNVGREIDRIRIEAQAQAGAPVFEQWLRESRNTASHGATPIPPQIRQQLQGFYSEELLNSVRYKIGDGGVFNLASLSIQYGGAAAVTLIDVIVFTSPNDAYGNAELWAHELKHVQQFAEWGVRDFAIRYLRSWNSVEGEAYAAGNSFLSWRNSHAQSPIQAPVAGPIPVGAIPAPAIAAFCATPLGACGMGVQIPVGAQCYCPSFNGPIWGVAR